MGNVKCFFSERKEGDEIEDCLVVFFFFSLAAVVTKLGLSFRWPNLKWVSCHGTLYENLVKTL